MSFEHALQRCGLCASKHLEGVLSHSAFTMDVGSKLTGDDHTQYWLGICGFAFKGEISLTKNRVRSWQASDYQKGRDRTTPLRPRHAVCRTIGLTPTMAAVGFAKTTGIVITIFRVFVVVGVTGIIIDPAIQEK